MKEVCSCGSSFEYERPGDPLSDDRFLAVLAALKAWRNSHRHEFAPAHRENHDEPPFVDEAGSSHERAIGFAVAPEGGWI